MMRDPGTIQDDGDEPGRDLHSWAVPDALGLESPQAPHPKGAPIPVAALAIASLSAEEACLLFSYDMPPAYSTNRNQPADLDDGLHNHQSDDDMDGVEASVSHAAAASRKRARASSSADAMRDTPPSRPASHHTHSDKQPPLLNLRAISQQKHLSRRSSLQLPPLDGSPSMRQLGLAAAIQPPQGRGPTHRNMPAPSSPTRSSPHPGPSFRGSSHPFTPPHAGSPPLSDDEHIPHPSDRDDVEPFRPSADLEDGIELPGSHFGPGQDHQPTHPVRRPPTPLPEPEEEPLDLDLDPFHPEAEMLADDPINGDDLIDVANNGAASILQSQEEYENLPRTTYNLSQLKRMFYRKDARGVRAMLAKKVKLTVDQKYMADLAHHDTVSGTRDHFLDYIMYVPNEPGCRAIIPIEPELRWTFFLKVNETGRAFKNKHGIMGFPLEGRVMFIGTAGTILNILLVLAPPTFFGPEPIEANQQRRRRREDGTTVPSWHDRLVVLAFLSHALATLSQLGVLEMEAQHVRQLDSYIKRKWADWIKEAPDSYRHGDIISDAKLIFVAYKYGQNRPIGRPGATSYNEDEADRWGSDIDVSYIRYISVALATHAAWTRIPAQTIIDKHGDSIFLDPDQEFPVQDLHALDPADDADNEADNEADNDNALTPIYDELGKQIPRLKPHYLIGSRCGLLVNLPTMLRQFRQGAPAESHRDWLHYSLSSGAPGVPTVYPLAFTGSYGQLQAAGGGFPAFHEALDLLNLTLAGHDPEELAGSPESGDDLVEATVELLSVQMYNQVSHRVRPSSALHAVQQGRLTKAAVGYFAVSPSDKRKAQDCMRKAGLLPHKEFENQVKPPSHDIPRCLRMENVFCIKVEQIPVEKRNGRFVYESIVCPLLDAWALPTVWGPLKESLVAFVPKAFPNMISWASYPITSLIETIFARIKDFIIVHPTIQANASPNFYDIELLSMLERTLNFCHTGSPKVLTKTSMNHFWLSLGIATTGFPSLNPTVPTDLHKMNYRDWPLDSRTRMPLTASSRSISFTYGHVYDVVRLRSFDGPALSVAPLRPLGLMQQQAHGSLWSSHGL
ncbi:hypothetical protein BC834DRAFT_972719 [Gloeopeniophorella convolvens]|nr:hypothetical protein BC834DRAFT_972719 [Gloeopeniophorella convolvens]